MSALWDVLRAEVWAKAIELKQKGAANALKEAAAESRQAAATTGGWLWGSVKDLVAGPGSVPLIRASGIPAMGAVVPLVLPSGCVVEAEVLEVDGRYCPLRARVELREGSPDATARCSEVLWAEVGGPASATDLEGATLNMHSWPTPGDLVQVELLKGGHATATVMSVYFEERPRAWLSIPGSSETVSVPIQTPTPRDVSEPTALEAAAVVSEALHRELRDTAAVSAISEKARSAVDRVQPLAKEALDTARQGAKQAQNFTVDLLGLDKSRNFDREPMRVNVNQGKAMDSRLRLLEERTESSMPLLEQRVDSQVLPEDFVAACPISSSEAATTSPCLLAQDNSNAAVQVRAVVPEDGDMNIDSKLAKADGQTQLQDFLE